MILGVCSAAVATASFALMKTDSKQLELPPLASNQTIAKDIEAELNSLASAETVAELIQYNWIIESGDSLSAIFSKLGLDKDELHNIIHTNQYGKLFESLATGKMLQAKINQDGRLEQLFYEINSLETLTAIRDADQFTFEMRSKEVQREIASVQTTINSSLYLDGKKAGLSNKTIMELADIFAWDIDFALNLQHGDLITVMYEKLLVNGHEIDTGDIIAAEVINRGNTYTAIRFKDNKGKVSYYSPDGKRMRKAFLRSPVDFARISSHFNLKRKHPVLNKIRAHKGVDYAAKTGTPVKSTSDGKIIFRGRKGGYGRVVIVQHGKSYSTLYAHLSSYGKGQKVGSHVKQGEIIGRVGSSGLATGPHLHYEFRVNNVHRNPLTIRLPNSDPIDKTLLADFKQQTQPLLNQLKQIKSTLLATNEQMDSSS